MLTSDAENLKESVSDSFGESSNADLSLGIKIKKLEKKVEEWGRRCDEADVVEQELRLQLHESTQKWKAERLSLTQTIEQLKKENEDLNKEVIKLQSMDNAEKLELEDLRCAKKTWLKDKRKKNEEIAVLTARIIALRKELRRFAQKNSGDLSPTNSLLSAISFENVENIRTPTRNADVEIKMPPTSKLKSSKSSRLYYEDMRSRPFCLDDSP